MLSYWILNTFVILLIYLTGIIIRVFAMLALDQSVIGVTKLSWLHKRFAFRCLWCNCFSDLSQRSSSRDYWHGGWASEKEGHHPWMRWFTGSNSWFATGGHGIVLRLDWKKIISVWPPAHSWRPWSRYGEPAHTKRLIAALFTRMN